MTLKDKTYTELNRRWHFLKFEDTSADTEEKIVARLSEIAAIEQELKPVYKIKLLNGKFDHVRGMKAAVARANEMLGERDIGRATLQRDWGVRIERVSAEIARSVGL